MFFWKWFIKAAPSPPEKPDDVVPAVSILDAVPCGLLILDAHFRVLMANDRAARALDVADPSRVVGRRLKILDGRGEIEIATVDAREEVGWMRATITQDGGGATTPVTLKTVRTRKGLRYIVTCAGEPEPRPGAAAGPLRQRDSLVFLADLVIVVDDGDRIVDCKGWDTLRSASSKCDVNDRIQDVFPADSRAALSEALTRARAGDRAQCVLRLPGEQGNVWLQMRAGPEFDNNGRRTGVALVARDITELKVREKKLRDRSYRDALTGAFNRRYLFERMNIEYLNARRYQRPLSLAVGDLDRFKELNDNAGHRVGDEVLRIFTDSLRSELRADSIIARFGGDEFVILFPLTTAADAAAALKRAQRTLEMRCRREKRTNGIRATASFGVAEITDVDESANDLFEAADKALYHAKNRGRHRIALRIPDPMERGGENGPGLNRTLTEIDIPLLTLDRDPS